ncbi:MAG: hypothetical protein CSB55_05215 [Candidatus Cloacimonadota bacterium]|nr:MAG: hypothetical protein CSB55_05215 [Candidatus Cloacimonadota bacterium]
MINNKIISNYEIIDDDKDLTGQNHQVYSVPKIIKKAIIEEGIEEHICKEPDLPDRNVRIEAVRNENNEVVGFDIVCKCGETFSIELEYE